MNEFELLIDLHRHNLRQGHSPEARELVASDKQEYEMYLQCKEYYTYGLFVVKKQ